MSTLTIEARLKRLNKLSADERAQLETDISATYDAADENDDVDTMQAMVDALEKVYDATEKTAAEDEESKDDGDDEKSGETATQPDPEPEHREAEETETPDGEKVTQPVADPPRRKAEEVELPPGQEAPESTDPREPVREILEPTDDKTTQATTTTNEETLPMAASGQTDFQPPAEAQPVTASAMTAIVAGADIQGYSAGTEFKSLGEVSDAFIKRINSVKRSGRGGDGEQVSVATIVASIPEDRMLAMGDAQDNGAKIDAVAGENALMQWGAEHGLTASGGFCAPLPVNYSIFGLGSTARPVRDSLPGFGATRGGVRFIVPPKLGDYTGALGIWTAANDANPAVDGNGDVVPKPCLKVNCAAEDTAVTDAITLCLEFGNLMTRAFPELVARHNQLALVQHARFAELNLLSKISAKSMAVTSSFKLGVARDFLLAIGKASGAYRNRHRVSRTMPLRVIAPEWVLDAMREDIAQGLPGDRLAEADAVISSYLAARNVNVTWHMDDTYPTQNAGAIVDFPTTIKWYIFAEGTFLFLDGGTLDLGVVRDSQLVGTNDYKTFVETFEGVAKVGLESVQVTTTTHVNGSVVGTTAPA